MFRDLRVTQVVLCDVLMSAGNHSLAAMTDDPLWQQRSYGGCSSMLATPRSSYGRRANDTRVSCSTRREISESEPPMLLRLTISTIVR